MTISMKEIGKRANVHESTVSKVINNYSEISTKTKEKVSKLLNKLNYHPNILARRLSKKKSFTIGVFMRGLDLLDRFDFFYFGEILMGVMAVANKGLEYDILVQSPQDGKDPYNCVRLFDEQKIDGAVIIFPRLDDPGVEELEKRRLPAVLVNNSEYKLDYVETDNEGGMVKALEYLVELGHKRIGLINLSKELSVVFQEVLRIYQATLLKYNIPYIEELVVHGGYDETAGYEGGKKLLVHKPTAIFTADCRLALGAMRAIQEAGLRIPEDIMVSSINEIPLAISMVPPLTAVRPPLFELGREAMNMLITRIEEKPKKQQKKVLPVELIIRGSTQNDRSNRFM